MVDPSHWLHVSRTLRIRQLNVPNSAIYGVRLLPPASDKPLLTTIILSGFDPTEEPYGEVPCGYGACYVRWAGKDMATSSVLLNLNGIGFAVQVVVFLLLGATADFGNFRPYILVAWTLITAGTGLGWWALQDPAKWQVLAGMVSLLLDTQTNIHWNLALTSL